MTVALASLPVTLAGNGATRVWPYTFDVTDETEIRLHLTDPDGVITEVTEGFTVNLVDSEVTYPVDPELVDIPATDWTVTISRSTPRVQEIDLVNGGPMPAETIEEGLDYLTRVVQEIDEALSRCPKFPIGHVAVEGETDIDTVMEAISGAAAAASAALASEASAAASAVSAGISETNAASSESTASAAAIAAAASETAAAISAANAAASAGAATPDTYANLKAAAVPGSIKIAYATDLDQLVFYCGDPLKNDEGWRIIG